MAGVLHSEMGIMVSIVPRDSDATAGPWAAGTVLGAVCDDLDFRLQGGYVVLHGTSVELELPTDFWWGHTSEAEVARLVLGRSPTFLNNNIWRQTLARKEAPMNLAVLAEEMAVSLSVLS